MKENLSQIPQELIAPSTEFIRASAQIGLHWWYWNHLEKSLMLSPHLLTILGYSQEEFDPKMPSVYKNIHPDDVKDNLEKIRRLIYGKDELYEIEFRVKDHKGEWQWYYNRGTVLGRDETGKATVVGGITIDMSGKYKSLMTKADENERLYRTLIDAADDAIGLFTVEMEIILFNPAFHETFGYKLEEFVEHGWMGIIHPEDRDQLDSRGKELLKNGSLSVDFRVRHKNGSYLFVSSKNVIIPTEDGDPDMILTIIRDVSERKKEVEELEKAKERAEESDMLKSAFLANMSHEIRTPMNSIVGFSNLLVNPALDEAARNMYVQRIVRNSELLLALISDIIDLAKIESKQLPLVYGKQKLSVLLAEMKQYALDETSRLNKPGIEIFADEEESDCEIETDVVRISQIMKNLVNNAIKFTESGKVGVGCMPASSKSDVILYVEDSGVGISAENFNIIFDQFRQVDGSNTRKFGGTGLGLAICKNLVEMMGGKIWVESIEGKGAIFKVELPRKARLLEDRANTTKPEKGFETKQGRGLEILVVDDEQDSLELFYEILSGMGHQVGKAASGFEALQLLEKGPLPNMVFMDDQMDILSGTETMRIIKERHPGIKVVAQSAHALVGDRTRFLEQGFDAYLPKPFSVEQLKDILSLFPSG
ncbi:MAG: PAS domain-containing protein [Bacteroides sp.]|nr:PAS domain-containing protein [Bacteroides sp.]